MNTSHLQIHRKEMYSNPKCSAVQKKQKQVWEENTCKRRCLHWVFFCLFLKSTKKPTNPQNPAAGVSICWWFSLTRTWPKPGSTFPVCHTVTIFMLLMPWTALTGSETAKRPSRTRQLSSKNNHHQHAPVHRAMP